MNRARLDSLGAKKNAFREFLIDGDEIGSQSHHDEKGVEDQAPCGQNDGLIRPFAMSGDMPSQESWSEQPAENGRTLADTAKADRRAEAPAKAA